MFIFLFFSFLLFLILIFIFLLPFSYSYFHFSFFVNIVLEIKNGIKIRILKRRIVSIVIQCFGSLFYNIFYHYNFYFLII